MHKENAQILPTVKLNNTKASDKTEKNNLFNIFFSSVLNENTEISSYRLTLQSKISIFRARLLQFQLKHPKEIFAFLTPTLFFSCTL